MQTKVPSKFGGDDLPPLAIRGVDQQRRTSRTSIVDEDVDPAKIVDQQVDGGGAWGRPV
jgi:hypothetical protein